MSDKVLLLPPQRLLALLAVFVLVMCLHLSQLPVWMFVVASGVFVWRINIMREVWRAPRSLVKVLLLSVTSALLYREYSQWFSLEPMLVLLLLSLTLKLLELRSERDIIFLIFVSYFAIACSFLFAQSVLHTLLALGAVVVTTTVLLQVYHRQVSFVRLLGLACKILLQSALLASVMMLVLPRFNPLWSVPLQSDTAMVGMSDSMSPGAFDQLIKSDRLAFRVTFDEQRITRDQMYWRGLVFDDFDGRRWQRSVPVAREVLFSKVGRSDVVTSASTVRYQVLMEATGHHWLYGVPRVVITPNGSDYIYTAQDEVLQKQVVSQRIQYSATSYLHGVLPQAILSSREYQRYTALPQSFNPKTRKQAQQWRYAVRNTEDYIDSVLTYYKNNFVYTLSPPTLGRHTVDDFLFSTQEGFCEHFASSFVVLMRSVGIPARVVVGYQGGEWDRDNTYLRVYQRDAHAWAEVWIEGQGWLRVDPTAAVASVRTEQGVAAALPQADRGLVGRSHYSFAWLRQLENQWQVMDYRWQSWVLSYDTQKQQSLLKKYVGDLTPLTMLLLIFIPLCVAIIVICFSVFGYRAAWMSKEKKAFLALQKTLARLGVEYQVGDTITHYCDTAIKKYPHLREPLSIIQNECNNIFYASSSGDEKKRQQSLRTIQQQIHHLR